jgi:hypothetical protein
VPERLPEPAEVRAYLLDALHFEDDQGLWEPVWWLNTRSPDLDRASKVSLVRSVVLSLLEEGLIELRRTTSPPDEGTPVTRDELDRLRSGDPPWYDPERTDLLVTISEVGHP